MARNMYGATSADFTITSGGRVIPGAVLTLWTARTGGTQITDLLDVDSVATTTVTSAADGSVVYYGPNNDKTVHWADSGQGSRVAIRPTDITGDPPVMSIGTVGTGTAAASLTGTSEAPVLNLTLPAVGDGAIEPEMFGDDTQPGNLLTANQASGTDTLGDTTGIGAGGATVASSTSYAAQGSRSLQITTTSTGSGGAYFGGGSTAGTIPVTGGDVYTALAWFYAASVTEPMMFRVYWFQSNGTTAASTAYNESATITTAASWKEHKATFTAPTDAAFASVYIRRVSGGSGSVIHVDKISFHRGAGGQWAMPGVPITDTGIRPNPSNTSEVQVWNSATATWITV